MVALQASSMRQSTYTPWSAGRGLSKQTAVSVVLNVLHVHVRKQKSVISKYKRFPGAVSVQSFCQILWLFCKVLVTSHKCTSPVKPPIIVV